MGIRIIDKRELGTMPEGTVIWMELREYDNLYADFRRIQPLVMYNDVYANNYSMVVPGNVDSNMRFWSYRPTIQTMDETPWEEE